MFDGSSLGLALLADGSGHSLEDAEDDLLGRLERVHRLPEGRPELKWINELALGFSQPMLNLLSYQSPGTKKRNVLARNILAKLHLSIKYASCYQGP